MFADHYGPRQNHTMRNHWSGTAATTREAVPYSDHINHPSRDQLLEFRTSFYETISVEFLVQGNFNHTQFSREQWYWRDSNSHLSHPKWAAVLIELTWLLQDILFSFKIYYSASSQANLTASRLLFSFKIYYLYVTIHHKRALKSASTCFWFAELYNHPIAVTFEKNRGPVMLIISARLVMD